MRFPITLKTYMGSILLILAIIGIIKNGVSQTLPQLLIALAATIPLDLIINYYKEKRFILPDSATISALFIATALSINQLWYTTLIAGIVAILSKHIIKINDRHIFNPAVFGLFAVILIFKVGIEWWASQILWIVTIFGVCLMYKMKNYKIILSYLITSLVLSTAYLLTKDSLSLKTLFFSINLFFMFFMMVEPMTAPITKKAKMIFGILVAVLSFLILIFMPRFEPSITALVLADLFVPLLNKLAKY